jgi:hypothetical protein
MRMYHRHTRVKTRRKASLCRSACRTQQKRCEPYAEDQAFPHREAPLSGMAPPLEGGAAWHTLSIHPPTNLAQGDEGLWVWVSSGKPADMYSLPGEQHSAVSSNRDRSIRDRYLTPFTRMRQLGPRPQHQLRGRCHSRGQRQTDQPSQTPPPHRHLQSYGLTRQADSQAYLPYSP